MPYCAQYMYMSLLCLIYVYFIIVFNIFVCHNGVLMLILIYLVIGMLILLSHSLTCLLYLYFDYFSWSISHISTHTLIASFS